MYFLIFTVIWIRWTFPRTQFYKLLNLSWKILIPISLATLVLTHHVQPWHVYVTGFLAGTVQAFQQPARQVGTAQRRAQRPVALTGQSLDLLQHTLTISNG